MSIDPNLSGVLPTEEDTEPVYYISDQADPAEVRIQASTMISTLAEMLGSDCISPNDLERLHGNLITLADEVGYIWGSCNDPDEICPTCGGTGTVDLPPDNYGDSYKDLL